MIRSALRWGFALCLPVAALQAGAAPPTASEVKRQAAADHPYCLQLLQAQANGDHLIHAVRLGRKGCADNNKLVDLPVVQEGGMSSVEVDGNRHEYRLAETDRCGHRYYHALVKSLTGSFSGRSLLVVKTQPTSRYLFAREQGRVLDWQTDPSLVVVADVAISPVLERPAPIRAIRQKICR
jgi:hypothetical protein